MKASSFSAAMAVVLAVLSLGAMVNVAWAWEVDLKGQRAAPSPEECHALANQLET